MITPLQMGVLETIELHRLFSQNEGDSLQADTCRDRLEYCFKMLSEEDMEFLNKISAKLQVLYHEDWKNVALKLGELLSTQGPEKYYTFTPEQWFEWAKSKIEEKK